MAFSCPKTKKALNLSSGACEFKSYCCMWQEAKELNWSCFPSLNGRDGRTLWLTLRLKYFDLNIPVFRMRSRHFTSVGSGFLESRADKTKDKPTVSKVFVYTLLTFSMSTSSDSYTSAIVIWCLAAIVKRPWGGNWQRKKKRKVNTSSEHWVPLDLYIYFYLL